MDESKRLQDFLNRMAKDSDFEKRVKEDKNVLSELGWSPEAISDFQVKRSDKSMDDFSLSCGSLGCGTECGCSPSVGEGNGHVCSGGHGS